MGDMPLRVLTLLDLSVSSLRRGHANLLCIVPILTDDPRRESMPLRVLVMFHGREMPLPWYLCSVFNLTKLSINVSIEPIKTY